MREQWNVPTRSDFLLMRVAQRVLQLPALVWGKMPRNINLEDQDVKFDFTPKKPLEKDAQAASLLARSRWIGWLGGVDGIKFVELQRPPDLPSSNGATGLSPYTMHR